MKFVLDDTSGLPAYQQIEAQVRAAIASGELGPGDRLPAERGLSASIGVSRMTVRNAFDALARRGVVERGVGRGTFVTVPHVDIDRTERVSGFTEQMERAGIESATEVLGAGVVAAPKRVAEALQIEPGAAVAQIHRVRSGGGVAVTLAESWLPESLFPGIAQENLTGSLYDLMGRHYGRAPVRAVEHLQSVAARVRDAALLGINARAPVMLVERVAYDAAGTPVEHATDRHRGDRARFVVQVASGG